MKKAIISLIILSSGALSINAQNLYKTVLERSQEVVSNPSSADEALSVSQFKIDVLNFITSEMKKAGVKKDPYFYDSQAVNLESFLTDYHDNMVKAKAISAAKSTEIMKIYQNATIANTLVNEADEAKTHTYIIKGAKFTPFSLNTDWELAYDEATRKAKAALK